MNTYYRHTLALLLVVGALTFQQTNTLLAQEQADSRLRGNVDQVLPYPMAAVHLAAKQALLAYGCESDAKKEKPSYLECRIPRGKGIFLPSGGEKVSVALSASGAGTQVVVKTGKGIVGIAGKKNRSADVFREMEQILHAQ